MISNNYTFKSFLERIKNYDQRVALIHSENDRRITFNDLVASIYKITSQLSDIDTGDKVILYNLNSLDWIQTFFAIILKGGIAVPLDNRIDKEFFHEIITSIEASHVICDRDTKINLGQEKGGGINVMSFQDVIQRSISHFSQVCEDSDRVSIILFTSGSWGVPKGVMLSQRNILTNVKQILEKYEVNNTDCVLSLLPLSHAYQLTAGMMVPLSQGVSNVFLSEVHSENLRRTIHKYEVTTLIAVPKVLKVMYGSIIRKFRSKYLRNFISRGVQMMIVTPLIVRRWLFRRAHLYLGPSLEKILVGGAFLPRYLDEFFQGAGYQVFIGYGLTETSPVVTISSSGKRKDGSVGYPVRGVQISQSEKGELLVSGDNVFLGYYPELRVDREFNTRDIVRITESGEIFIKGRTKNMITWPSGDKFFAEDLEYYIRRYCDVEEVCVVSEDVPDQSPRILVAIIPEKNTIVSVGEVQAVLPRFVRIQEVKNFSKEDFPYTHTFKPDRKTILESFTTLKDRE